MHVHFWGTRGSIPISITADDVRSKIRGALKAALDHSLTRVDDIDRFISTLPFAVQGTYGSNTSCLEIRVPDNDTVMICDAGTGLRDLGNHLMASRASRTDPGPLKANIFVTHPHWDHLGGFPFFAPAYVPGNQIHIYGFHKDMEKSFQRQQNGINFPLKLQEMQADIHFHHLDPDKVFEIDGFQIQGIKQNHPGISYGVSFRKNGKKVVYSTDAEHYSDVDDPDYPFVGFFRDADLLVFDSQYRFAEAVTTKEHWGHSSNMVGVELAIRAGVKRLCLFHNEPAYDDRELEKYHRDSELYASLCPGDHGLAVYVAYDGLVLEI